MKIIAGVDEVGRGSLIGPVYAAAVILNKKTEKKFSPKIEPQPVFKKEVKLLPVTYTDLPARGITKETCELFKYGVSVFKGQQCQVATYQNSQGIDVAQHIRFANKKLFSLSI